MREFQDYLVVESETAFGILKNSRLEYKGSDTLKSDILCQLAPYFRTSPETIRSLLFEFYFDAIHRTIEIDDIYDYLHGKGVVSSRTIRETTRNIVNTITKRYCDFQEAKLISGRLIKRDISQEIIKSIQTATKSNTIVITGDAGSGKSGVLFEVLQEIQKNRIPALAFRMDQLEATFSTKQLGLQLDLEQSPTHALVSAYEQSSVVLLIDQLDCMSTTSGRKSEFFDTFHQMMKEAQILRSSLPESIRFHVIIACRQFDFQNDHHFTDLVGKLEKDKSVDVQKHQVKNLSTEEVHEALNQAGYDLSRLSKKQVDLLTLPQNLSLFVNSIPHDEPSPGFQTQKDLFDRFWDIKRKNVEDVFPGSELWLKTISLLCNIMSDRQELSVAKSRLDHITPLFLEKMCSEGVILSDAGRYSFVHESFFDYCFARNLVAQQRDFITDLEKEEQQHFFRRSQLRQYLTFLRDSDFKEYLESISRILESDRILSHLKYLALSILVSWHDIKEDEWEIVRPYVRLHLDNIRAGQVYENSLETHVYAHFITSPTLLTLEKVQAEVESWLTSQDKVLHNESVRYFQYQIKNYPQKTVEIIVPFVEQGADWQAKIDTIIRFFHLADSRPVFEIFLRLLELGQYDDKICERFDDTHSFYGLPPEWAIELTTKRFQRILDVSRYEMGVYSESPLRNDKYVDAQNIFEASEKHPRLYIESIFPYLVPLANRFKRKPEMDEFNCEDQFWDSLSFNITYSAFGFGAKSERCNTGSEVYIVALENAFDSIAKDNPEALRQYIEHLKPHHLHITNYLLLRIYARYSEHFADEAISLIAAQPGRFHCGNISDRIREGYSVVSKCSLHCSEDNFRTVEQVLLNFFLEDDEKYDRKGFHTYSLRAARSLDKSRLQDGSAKIIDEWQREIDEAYPTVRTPERVIHNSLFNDTPLDLTNEEWIAAFSDSDEKDPCASNGMRREAFKKAFHETPRRFVDLLLNQESNSVNPSFLELLLWEIQSLDLPPEDKLSLAKKTMKRKHPECQRALISMLKSMMPFDFDREVIDYVMDVALHSVTENEHSWKSNYYGGDPLTSGLNTPRGAAIWFFYANLREKPEKYLPVIMDNIEQLSKIESDSIAANVVLLFLELWDESKEIIAPLAISMFQRVDEHVLDADPVRNLLRILLWHDHEQAIPIIYRLINSSEEKLNERGGKLAAFARLYHDTNLSNRIVHDALERNTFCRVGIAKIASRGLVDPENQVWCVKMLVSFFKDSDPDVRETTALCFHHLQETHNISSDTHRLIDAFIDTSAFFEHPSQFFRFLDERPQLLVSQSLHAVESIVEYYANANGLSNKHRELIYIDKLVSRLYATTGNQDKIRALLLINKMYEYQLADRSVYRKLERM